MKWRKTNSIECANIRPVTNKQQRDRWDSTSRYDVEWSVVIAISSRYKAWLRIQYPLDCLNVISLNRQEQQLIRRIVRFHLTSPNTRNGPILDWLSDLHKGLAIVDGFSHTTNR